MGERRYNLSPALGQLRVSTLVIIGEHDFMALAGEHISKAIPDSELVSIRDWGQFAFLECPGEVRRAMTAFFQRSR